jgi:hypothetical protein
MPLTGMNVAEVQHLADQLRAAADQLRHAVSTIDGRVHGTSWAGRDADTFRHTWWPAHRQALLHAADSLTGLGQSARNNADEQERASSAGTGGGGGGSSVRSFAEAGWTAVLPLGALGGATLGKDLLKAVRSGSVTLTATQGLERVAQAGGSGGGRLGVVPLSWSADAKAYRQVSTTESLKLSSAGLAASAGAGVLVGASAQAQGAVGNRYLGGNAEVHGQAEAGAKGSVTSSIGPSGVSGAAHGEIGASVGVGASAHGHVSGVEAGVSAQAYAGVQAHADVVGSISVDRIKEHVELGAALGIGAGVGFDVDVKPSQVVGDVTHAAATWTRKLAL